MPGYRCLQILREWPVRRTLLAVLCTTLVVADACLSEASLEAQSRRRTRDRVAGQDDKGKSTSRRRRSDRERTTRQANAAAREEFLKINTLFNRELYSLAVPRYEKLLEDHPSFAERPMALYALALCHDALAAEALGSDEEDAAVRRSEHLQKVAKHLESALADAGFAHAGEARDLLAQTRLDLGDPEGAVESFQWILDNGSDGQKAPASVGLADALIQQGKHEEAAQAYRSALEIEAVRSDPALTERAFFQLGLALYNLADRAASNTTTLGSDDPAGDAQEIPAPARAQFEEATGIFQGLAGQKGSYAADALYMGALCNQRVGLIDEAIRQFRTLTESADTRLRESALYGLGTLLFQKDDFAGAETELAKLKSEFPSSRHVESADLVRGRALLNLGKLRTGARILADLRSSEQVGEEASLWLARAYASRDKHEVAIKVLRRALEVHTNGRYQRLLQTELATELVSEGQLDEAQEVLGQLTEGGEADASSLQALYLQAFALHGAKKYEASMAISDRFRDSWPESRFAPELAYLSAENRFFLQRFDAALEGYENFLQTFGERSKTAARLHAGYRIAECHYFSKRYDEAIQSVRALQSGPLKAELEESVGRDSVLESFYFLVGDSLYQKAEYGRAERSLSMYLAAGKEGDLENPEDPNSRDPGEAAPRFQREALFRLAHARQLSGDLAGATAAYENALATDPESPHTSRMQFELGQIAVSRKDWTAASESFGKYLEAEPASEYSPYALRFLGWFAQKEGLAADSQAYYRRIVDEFPESELHAEALYLLSLSLQDAGKHQEARQLLTRLRRDHPGNDHSREARLQEAVSFAREEEYDKARALLEELRDTQDSAGEEALSVAPRLHYELAWCYRRQEETQKAIDEYRSLLDAVEKNADKLRGADQALARTARLELAELEFDADHFDVARDLLRSVVAADIPSSEDSPPGSPAGEVVGAAGPGADAVAEKALYQLSWCNYRLDDASGLAKTYDELVAKFPDSSYRIQTALLLARQRIVKQDFAKARELLETIVHIEPAPPELEQALISYAECLNETRAFEKASKAANRFLDTFPESRFLARAWFALGWSRENQSREDPSQLDEAVEAYRKASASPTATGARALFQVGQCQVAKKDYEAAVIEFLQVPARFSYPEWNARALLQIAGCFETLDDSDKARKYYREVIQKYADSDEAKLAQERLDRVAD